MKRWVGLPLIAVLTVALVSCTAPLGAKDVSTSISVVQDKDVIVGDDTAVSASGTLANSRTDKIEIALESSLDGVVWKTIQQEKTEGPTFQISASETQSVAGTVTYRVTVSEPGKANAPLSSVVSAPISVIDLPQLIRTFYYDSTAAYLTGSAAGLDWTSKHSSPEIDQTTPGWAEGNAILLAANYTESVVPDLTTISPDPTWIVPASKCNPAGVAPPKGRTFIVSVAFGSTFNEFVNTPATADVHVTLLDGALFDYRGCY